MVAAASGFRSASQSFDVAAGQTLVWSPTLAPAIKAKPVVPRVTPPVKVIPKGEADGGPRPETAVRPPRLGVPTVTCGTLFAALDWARALTLCTKEASDGGTTAQRALGTMYERGLGTETNEATAAGWYTKAADGGDHLAQVRLGSLLRDGRGVNRDEKTAITWFQKAAEQGDADGQWALGDMLERGKGVKKNRTEAAGWYQKAAEQGHPAAQYNLGVLLAKGDGVPKNEAEAVTWFTKSAAQGNTKAADELRKRGRS
jgi:TPR repeat protein